MERYCTNCRAELPRDAEICPACGVFAGDLFDGMTDEQNKQRRALVRRIIVLVTVATALAAALLYFLPRWISERPRSVTTQAAPIRVVKQRPGGTPRAAGAAISEAEAALLLRRHFTSAAEPIRDECIAAVNHGFRDGAYVFTVVDSCRGVRMGKWRVEGRSGSVTR